jgi:hypothetical protein
VRRCASRDGWRWAWERWRLGGSGDSGRRASRRGGSARGDWRWGGSRGRWIVEPDVDGHEEDEEEEEEEEEEEGEDEEEGEEGDSEEEEGEEEVDDDGDPNQGTARGRDDRPSSLVKGVIWDPRRRQNNWVATTRVGGKSVWLGLHATEEAAAQAGTYTRPLFSSTLAVCDAKYTLIPV